MNLAPFPFHAAYAEQFRARWLTCVSVDRIDRADARRVFSSPVLIYPIVTIMTKLGEGVSGVESVRHAQSLEPSLTTVVNAWLKRLPTIEDAGCRIRVGPALGCEAAFVGKAVDLEVEQELLLPYLRPREIVGDQVKWAGYSVIDVFAGHDGLIDIKRFPQAARHFEIYEKCLRARACIRNNPAISAARWYRTIDMIDSALWSRDKILLPEIMRSPRLALDVYGYLPSHGIYAIFSESWPLSVLRNLLACGVFGLTMECIAPRLNGNYMRCYKRFLSQIRLPLWNEIPVVMRKELQSESDQGNRGRLSDIVAEIYGVQNKLLARFQTDDWRRSLHP